MSDETSELKILLWPHPMLGEISEKVEKVDTELIERMFVLMEKKGGVGLSAIQVGIPQRFFIAKVAGLRKVFINPEWTTPEKSSRVDMIEGCLSTPGIFETVRRYPIVNIKYFDTDMNLRQEDLTDIWAQIVQHESDHLNGDMYVDLLKSADRSRVRGNMMNYKRNNK